MPCSKRIRVRVLIVAAVSATAALFGAVVAPRAALAAQVKSTPAKPSAKPKPAPPAKAPLRVDQLTATTTNMSPGSGEMVTIDVTRWSTDAEAQQIAGAVTDKGDKLLAALQAAPTVGYLWVATDSVGYPLRYAAHTTTPDGAERIVLATNRPLGPDVAPWRAAAHAAPADYGFSLIELRIARGAAGEGKATLAAKIAVAADKKGIGLDDYAAAPVLFKDVKRGGAAAAVSRPAAARTAPARKAPAAKKSGT